MLYSQLITIFANRDVQLTNTGMPGVIYNGIPDWVFEEEVFEDNFALWWSPDASKLVINAFNQSISYKSNINQNIT